MRRLGNRCDDSETALSVSWSSQDGPPVGYKIERMIVCLGEPRNRIRPTIFPLWVYVELSGNQLGYYVLSRFRPTSGFGGLVPTKLVLVRYNRRKKKKLSNVKG